MQSFHLTLIDLQKGFKGFGFIFFIIGWPMNLNYLPILFSQNVTKSIGRSLRHFQFANIAITFRQNNKTKLFLFPLFISNTMKRNTFFIINLHFLCHDENVVNYIMMLRRSFKDKLLDCIQN